MAIVMGDVKTEPDRVTGPGVIDNGETSGRLTRTIDSAGVAFGKALFVAPIPKTVTATPNDNFIGISIADKGVVTLNWHPAADAYEALSSVGILSHGLIWVLAGSNTTALAPVFITPGGAFTASSSGNRALPAVFRDVVNAGAFVRIRVK